MKRFITILVWIVVSIFFLLFAASVYLYIEADRLATGYIKNFLAKEPLKGHVIGFSDFEFSILDRSVKLDSVYILPDTTISGKRSSSLDQLQVNLVVKNLQVKGISLIRLLINRVVKVDACIINHPGGYVRIGKKDKFEEEEKQQGDTPQSTLKKKPPLRKIKFGLLDLSHADIIIFGEGDQDTLIISKDLNFQLSALAVNMNKLDEMDEALSMEAIKLDSRDFEMILPGKYYDLVLSSIDVEEADSTITMGSLKLIPRYSKKEFGYEFGRQMDRFDVSVDEILVRGIDLPCLLFSGAFRASYIEVKGPYADIYRDKNVPRKNEKIKPLLNELVVGMKLPITIDSLRAFDAHVVYEEVPEGKHDPGVVFINNFNLVVSNITNDPERITGNAKMELNGGFLLEGAGPAHVQISYPLDNLSKRYSYTVDIAGMSLARLNPWLSPQAGLFIKTGDLRRARFEISATSDSAWGNAYMVYEGLNMKVLKKNPKHEDRQVNKFFSGLANSLMHKDNPSKKTGAERVGLITFERDKYKSMIGFLVKPMMQGMKRIIIPVDNNVEKIEHLSPRMKKKEEQISAKKAKKLKKLEERNSRK